MSRRSVVVGGVYLLAVALLVLTPISRQLSTLVVWLYVQWNYTLDLPGEPLPETFEFALNVVMFVPLGLLVVLSTRRSWGVAVLVAVVLSGLIELVQAVPLLHRTTSWHDVVSNSLGGLLGALLAVGLRRRSGRTATPQPTP